MIILSKHIVLTTRLFVILFIVANAGFTTVIRQCTMEPSHPMDCCAASGERNSTPISGPRSQGEATVIGVLPDCSISTVVGGLANTPALLEKENTIHSSKIITSIPLSEQPAFLIPLPSSLSTPPILLWLSPRFRRRSVSSIPLFSSN